MAYQVNFPEFKSGSERTNEAINQGINTFAGIQQLTMQADEMKQRRRQQEWQKDLAFLEHNYKYAGTKGVSPESAAQLVNTGHQILQKWYPNMKFPNVTAETFPDYAPVLKDGISLINELEKDPKKYDFVLGQWAKRNTEFDIENMGQKEMSDYQRQARDNITNTLKNFNNNINEKSKQGVSATEGLRKEFINQSKDFATTSSAFKKVVDSANVATAAGDMSMIFGYMKLLDPGSTVREGEYATAESARGIPASVVAAYNKALKGEKLTPDQRQDFVNTAEQVYVGQEELHGQREDEYRRLAVAGGGDPSQVVFEMRYKRPKKENGGLSSEDQQAIMWAQQNQNDPRAAQILQLHGGK